MENPSLSVRCDQKQEALRTWSFVLFFSLPAKPVATWFLMVPIFSSTYKKKGLALDTVIYVEVDREKLFYHVSKTKHKYIQCAQWWAKNAHRFPFPIPYSSTAPLLSFFLSVASFCSHGLTSFLYPLIFFLFCHFLFLQYASFHLF